MSHIKKVIAIVSGKGGVGKSSVTSMLAVSMRRLGYRVAILDADITGPSIPKAFGIPKKHRAAISAYSRRQQNGNTADVDQSLAGKRHRPCDLARPDFGRNGETILDRRDLGRHRLYVHRHAAGTGDVPLTVFQSLRRRWNRDRYFAAGARFDDRFQSRQDGGNVHIPVLGVVENMAYFKCPDNDKEYKIFGKAISKKSRRSTICRFWRRFPSIQESRLSATEGSSSCSTVIGLNPR